MDNVDKVYFSICRESIGVTTLPRLDAKATREKVGDAGFCWNCFVVSAEAFSGNFIEAKPQSSRHTLNVILFMSSADYTREQRSVLR